MVLVHGSSPKKDGSPRRTVDLQKLSQATLHETHYTPSPFNQVFTVPPHSKKAVLDAWNGYHSLLLSPEPRDVTTFITEWGRYHNMVPQWDIRLQGMPTHEDLMISPWTCHERPALSTTPSCGMTTSKLHFVMRLITSNTVETTESSSTPKSLSSGRMKLTRRLLYHTGDSQTHHRYDQCHCLFPYSHKHHWYLFMVWHHQPGQICLCAG